LSRSVKYTVCWVTVTEYINTTHTISFTHNALWVIW